MNKTTKKLILFLLVFNFVFALLGMKVNDVKAEGLEVIKTHTGSDLTYRGSSEKVYKLSEYNYPTNQLRAVWVTVFAGDISRYTSETQFKQMMNNVLDDMDKMGMNAIVFHVRTHNNALYQSSLNPLASWWSGVDFDVFDPLEWLIDECHQRGIEFHAWLNPYRISADGSNSQYAAEALPAVNPANDENNLIKVGENVIFDPGVPEVRDFIVDTCMELIENYDVDAIHFDDYFYIDGADDTSTREKYNTENLSIGDFRRKQVDLFIEALSNEIRAYNQENHKAIQLGISPSGIYRNGGYQSAPTYDADGNLTMPTYSNTSGFEHYDDYLYSDTLNWINHEWIDYIMPQCYWAIEHSGASFVELTKWWSWAVRNKKVNFYTGLGIYMGADPSTDGSYKYWKYNENEIQLQLLNAGQYPEFDGACFYKYSSLKQTSSNVVNHAVNLISNEYWAKKIPGAISKYYAPLLDEVAPTTINYDEQTNTIHFNEVENSRGYMIYKVPKGTILDQNDINHIYQYIQTTSIVVDDFNNYNYYVASVNLANETSEAIIVNASLDHSTIISLIDNLPNPITYEDKSIIVHIRNLYDSLSLQEQQKVTNFNQLIAAEEIIQQYEEIEKQLQSYINTLDLHIQTNRVIPLSQHMTLQYKNIEDRNLYNIETGVKLKNYLAVKEIPLIITLTENNLSVSKEILVNIGYSAKNQNALFYRNDPSSMGPDDEGAYEEGQSGYIGWSGHTFVIENYMLFIALGNYHEIDDATNIQSCNWSSVAGVYVNQTKSNISFYLTDAFESKSSNNDGYIIVANNEIKTLVHGFDTSSAILLEPNEAIIIVRYLDTLITGSPMAPVTKLNVGMKAYIDEEVALTDEQKAQNIIAAIENLPLDITLANETTINDIKNQYDSLSDEAKLLVTNYQKLEEAIYQINQLKTQLTNKKQEAISELNDYLNLDNYSSVNQNLITTYINTMINQINDAQSFDSIDELVIEAKHKLDEFLTIEEELLAYKEESIEDLEATIDVSLYSEENKQKIHTLLEEAKSLIYNEAKSNDEVDKIVEEALKDIDNILTIEEEEAFLQQVKQEYIQKIDDLIASFTDITDAERQELIKDGESFKVQIRNATKQSDIAYIWTRAQDTIHLYFENVEKARQHAIDEIYTYIQQLSYGEKELIYIQTLAAEQEELVNKMASIEEIKKVSGEFITLINQLHEELVDTKTTVCKELDSLIKSWYTDSQKEYLTVMIDDAKNQIMLAGNQEEVNIYKDSCIQEATQYIEQLTKAMDEAKEYLNSLNADKANIKQLIYQYNQAIAQSKTTEEVQALRDAFDKAYLKLMIENIKEDINQFVSHLDYNDKEKELVKTKKEALFISIEKLNDIKEVELEVTTFKNEIQNHHQALLEAITLATNTIQNANSSTDEAKEYCEQMLEDIKKAGSLAEIEIIMADFDQTLTNLNNKASNCTCNDASFIYIFLSILFATSLVIFRKKH